MLTSVVRETELLGTDSRVPARSLVHIRTSLFLSTSALRQMPKLVLDRNFGPLTILHTTW